MMKTLAVTLTLLLAPAIAAQNTIADLVVARSGGATAGQFDNRRNDYDMLLTALQTANLVGAVADPNASLTVFAPNDAAFVRLARDLGYAGNDEAGAWNFLVGALTTLGNGDPIPVLTNVLLYHVVPEQITAFQLIVRTFFGQTIATALAGATIEPVFFRLKDNEPDLRDAFVRAPINLQASNGIVHGVTRVLLPVDLP